MSISAQAIPSSFRPGYEKAHAIDPVRADAYVKNTMVVDPIADAAVESLAELDRGEARRLIELGMNHQEEDLKAAPRELQDFFEFVKSPPSKDYFQREVALEGSRAFFDSSDMFMVAVVAKGLVENISTLMGQSFLSTGYTTVQGAQRLRTSLKQVLESMLPGGLEWYGDGWKLTVRARLAHAQGRRIISRQTDLWNVEELGLPISMAHVAYATASFSSGVLQALSMLGVRLSRSAKEGYVHNWRYIGWLMGVPDEVLLKDEADGLALLKVGRLCEPPPNVDSIIMAHAFINGTAIALVGREDKKELANLTHYIYLVTRSIVGKELADQLELPKGRTFGILAAIRWKRRIERLFSRGSFKAENFIKLLEAMEEGLSDYELHDEQYT